MDENKRNLEKFNEKLGEMGPLEPFKGYFFIFNFYWGHRLVFLK